MVAPDVRPGLRPEARHQSAWEAENARRRELAEREGVEPVLLAPISLHEGRHTGAPTFIAAGVSEKAIKSIMGHATIT